MEIFKRIRTKFIVESVTKHDNGIAIKLHVVYEGSEENKKYWEYTPSGDISLFITKSDFNKDFFKEGEEYYVDFSKNID